MVEIGAGLGALTTALAERGAERVLAIEFDRALVPALRSIATAHPAIEVLAADATKVDWTATLGRGEWIACGNLPYNVGTTIVLSMLEGAPSVQRVVVMVQREVAARLVAAPGDGGYGPTSLRVGYRAAATIGRSVPASVFWPRPSVASAVVRFERLERPPVDVDETALWRVVDEAFAQRRKTMRGAVRRLGVSDAGAVLAVAGVDPSARPEELDLAAFARVAEALPA